MFLWYKLIGITDSSDLIKKKARDELFLMMPGTNHLVFILYKYIYTGSAFCAEENAQSSYVRASFSIATEEQMELAISKLAALLKKERNLN
jgi:kynurenine/2-aminoadipate aminotransferase